MKHLPFILSLFMLACAPNDPASTTTPAAQTTGSEALHITYRASQRYLLHDMSVKFTRVTIINDAFESKDIFMLRTPAEDIVFMIDNTTTTFVENPSARYVALIKRSEDARAPEIDLGIQTLINRYAAENVLDVDRCRSLPIHPQVIDTLSAPRERIYFGMSDGQQTAVNRALIWDLPTNRVVGFKKLRSIPGPGQIDEQPLLLTPIVNPYGEDQNILIDSALLVAENYNSECDQKYGGDPKRKSSEPLDLNSLYTPRYDPKRDPFISTLVETELSKLQTAFGLEEAAYATYENIPLKPELLTSAKAQPSYKKFHGEF